LPWSGQVPGHVARHPNSSCADFEVDRRNRPELKLSCLSDRPRNASRGAGHPSCCASASSVPSPRDQAGCHFSSFLLRHGAPQLSWPQARPASIPCHAGRRAHLCRRARRQPRRCSRMSSSGHRVPPSRAHVPRVPRHLRRSFRRLPYAERVVSHPCVPSTILRQVVWQGPCRRQRLFCSQECIGRRFVPPVSQSATDQRRTPRRTTSRRVTPSSPSRHGLVRLPLPERLGLPDLLLCLRYLCLPRVQVAALALINCSTAQSRVSPWYSST
jgi:hypothetical protein